MYEVRGPGGEVSGPYSKAMLLDWIRTGQLPREAPVRLVGQAEFMPVEMVGELRGAFEAKVGGGSTLIPTGNPSALWAYYLGLGSCLPFLGLPLAIVALIQGRRGLIRHKDNPAIHGRGHAITGLVCGFIGLLINGFLCFGVIIALSRGAAP